MIEYKSRERKAPGLKRVYNWLGSTMQTFARELCPYLQAINCGGGGGNDGYANYVEVPISSAQILSFATGNVELLPALPSANEYYDYKLSLEYTAIGAGYTSNSTYQITSGTAYHGVFDIKQFQSNSVIIILTNTSTIPTSNTNRASYNAPYGTSVVIGNGMTPISGGTGTMLIKISYNISTIG